MLALLSKGNAARGINIDKLTTDCSISSCEINLFNAICRVSTCNRLKIRGGVGEFGDRNGFAAVQETVVPCAAASISLTADDQFTDRPKSPLMFRQAL